MKKLFKFFIPVVAVAAYSCATDMTEDLGVELGGGHTTIEVSLDGSRTYIAEAVGDKYPVYWSAYDQISVNGEASNPLTEGGSASATFEFGKTLETPYCVAYPAAETGQVLFAATQQHTDGTFGDGVAAMYGYSENGLGLTLNHLTGVLKIGVTGSATLTKAQISTIDRAPIAGAFAIDFTSGKLTPTAKSVDVINYSLVGDESDGYGEGMELSSEAQYIHVAVPAGVYNELYVTLYDTKGDVMYATVKATDEKPLTAGNVRTFSNAIEYAANANVFVVSSVATLQEFAAQAATLEKDVLFVADVDMTGVEWTSIEGYAGTVNGNGYAIKGLTAPLFGTTQASIRGLHLEDVNITETVNPTIGALARVIDNVDAVVEHCSASGNIIVDCTPTAEAWSAGIIGYAAAEGQTFSHLVNKVNVTIGKAGDMYDQLYHVAGCVAHLYGGHLTHSQNLGTITMKAGSSETLYMAGVVGKCATVESCINGDPDDTTHATGAVLFNGTTNSSIAIGGVIDLLCGNKGVNGGTGGAYIADAYNYANISLLGVTNGVEYVSGVVRQNHTGGKLERCYNYGKINYAAQKPDDSSNTVLGGILCAITGGLTVKDSHNHGEIEADVLEGSKTAMLQVGGVIATPSVRFSCNFGDVSNSGKITAKGSIVTSRVGGILGTIYKHESSTSTSQLTGTTFTNSGDIIVECTATNVHTGGIAGVFINAGDGYVTKIEAEVPIVNSGNITIKASGNQIYTGGIIGALLNNGDDKTTNFFKTTSSLTNNGTITIAEGTDATGSLPLHSTGGLVGYMELSTLSIGGVATNTKGITYLAANSTKNPGCATAGIVANSISSTITLGGVVSNSGAITFDGKAGYVRLGGVGGYWSKTIATIDGNITNSGAISTSEKASVVQFNAAAILGILHDASSTLTVNNSTILNETNGTVDIKGAIGQNESNAIQVGCFVGICPGKIVFKDSSFTNKGALTLSAAFAGDRLQAGTFAGNWTTIPSFTGSCTLKNEATVTYSGSTTTYVIVGGLIGICNKLIENVNLINTGDVICTGTYVTSGSTKVGGIAGNYNKVMTNARCYCNVKALGYPAVGMLSGTAYYDGTTNCHSGGTICTSTRKWEEGDDESLLDSGVPDVKTISAVNYHEYAFAGTSTEAATLKGASCGCLVGSVDAEPQYDN